MATRHCFVFTFLHRHIKDVDDAACFRINSVQNRRWLLLKFQTSAACTTLRLTVLWQLSKEGDFSNIWHKNWLWA